MKAPDGLPISDEAALTAKQHMHRSPVFENTFDFLVHRHVPDRSVVG